MHQPEHLDQLIAKHLSGEASETEIAIVNTWIAASDKNSKYFADIKLIYEASATCFYQEEVNTDNAWAKFHQKINQPKEPVLRKLFFSFYAKAAVILLIAGIGYFIYHVSSIQAEKEITIVSLTAERNYTLPDLTFVSLSKNSTITYKTDYNKQNRELEMAGEAYFHVQHNSEIPFIIHTDNVFIKDVGTSFNVKSIPADSTIIINVKEGEVAFYCTENSGILLTKDETGIYNKTLKTFRKTKAISPDSLYKSNVLRFEGATLQAVVDTLNNIYKVHIVIACNKLNTLRLTATFTEKNIDPIIETVAATFDLSVTKTPGTILLDSRTCN
jgi:transmembrane sensor